MAVLRSQIHGQVRIGHDRQAMHAPDHLLRVDIGEDTGGVHRGDVNRQEQRALLAGRAGTEPAPASRVHHDNVRWQKPCRVDSLDRVGNRRRHP